MAAPQKVEDKATEAIDKIAEAVKGTTDEQKEEVKERVASFVSHGISKAEELVGHAAKDFVDHVKGVKMASGEAPLPVSDKNVGESSMAAKSSEPPAADADGGDHGSTELPPSAENQPFLGNTPLTTQTSWKNCCGLFDCLNGSSE